MTLRELFKKRNAYMFQYSNSTNKNYFLFIEGLTEYGESIQDETFEIDKIKRVNIELIEDNGYCDVIETRHYGINVLDTTIDEIVEKIYKVI